MPLFPPEIGKKIGNRWQQNNFILCFHKSFGTPDSFWDTRCVDFSVLTGIRGRGPHEMFLLSLVAPIFQPAAARESGHNGLRNAVNVNTSRGRGGGRSCRDGLQGEKWKSKISSNRLRDIRLRYLAIRQDFCSI